MYEHTATERAEKRGLDKKSTHHPESASGGQAQQIKMPLVEADTDKMHIPRVV